MAKRFIETTIWIQNKWFRKLSSRHKLLWIFLITNCDAVGVWEKDMELTSFLIGDEYTVEDLKIFADRIEFITSKKIWIVDFCKFQYGVLSELSRPHQSFIKLLKNHNLLNRVEVQDKSNCVNAVRKRLTQTKKDEVLAKYKYECQYCSETGTEMVVDHIIPIVKGGDNSDKNLICICTDCNIKKSDLTLIEFYDKYSVSKKLDRVYKIINSLKDKDKEKDKDKDMVKDKEKDKINYAEFVKMTEKEYNTLIEKHGAAMTKKFIDKLDNYKGSSGKIYKNDYKAILTWVVDEIKSKLPPAQKIIPSVATKTDFDDLEHLASVEKSHIPERKKEIKQMIDGIGKKIEE